jgi:uncharacterized delta-60 repeat protein
MKTPLAELIPQLARVAAPSTAIATALVAPFAQAGTGDLDPSFADRGRYGPVVWLKGAARSVEARDEGGAILGGGDVDTSCYYSWYCWYDIVWEGSNFIDALNDNGAVDSAYDAGAPAGVEVFDLARQADGSVVAVGRRVGPRNPLHNKLTVFRLEPGGPLDAGFGNEGIVELDEARFGIRHQASSVLVQPDGRIVIAGARDEALFVLRLNADGSLDDSFGDAGAYAGPAHDYDSGSRIARVSSGGYRVTTTSAGSCRILALTAGGAVDTAYGDAGYAAVAADLGGAVTCHSIAVQDDDKLVIAGAAAAQAFAVRLLADGAPDPSFAAVDLAASVDEATAIAVAADGKILVGGKGVSGATIMRLQATGELDTLFGRSGATLIDLPSEYGASPAIHDLAVREDGSVFAAGGDYFSLTARPFAVRLLGDAGGDSPGVLSLVESSLEVAEDGEATIRVRRTGGASGEVSVAYRTEAGDGLATPGEDYEDRSDRLEWADGDVGERTVVVPILAGDDSPEEQEYFWFILSEPEGGAGIGTRTAIVSIPADGAPGGQFAMYVDSYIVSEPGVASLLVSRNFYYEGDVCVTLTPSSGSAVGGVDFDAEPVTHCWRDQETDAWYVEIPITNDETRENDESFQVALSDPTGGAVLGPSSSATITIAGNDTRTRSSGGGGGAAGVLSLLILGLGQMLRAGRRLLRIRAGDVA